MRSLVQSRVGAVVFCLMSSVAPALHPHHDAPCVSLFMQAYVHFVDVPSAEKAKDAIHGRMFAGNIVQAFFVALPTYQSVPMNV